MKSLVFYSILVFLALMGCKHQETQQKPDSGIIKTNIDEKGNESRSNDNHLPMFHDPFWYQRLTNRNFNQKYRVESIQKYKVTTDTD